MKQTAETTPANRFLPEGEKPLKETIDSVLSKTTLVRNINANAEFISKGKYKIQFNARLNRWRCSCNGYLKSGGKNQCKHIYAAKLKLIEWKNEKEKT
jgi:predicted nucleic acid-binding Zn finger protein